MSTVPNPTYFLAPNWTFKPGGRIAIGNIITNPLKPHLPITKADSSNTPVTDTSNVNNRELSVETALNLNVSLWTVFLEKINIGLSANRDRIKNSSFQMSSLQTISLAEDPLPEDIKKRCNDPTVKEYMRLDSMLCKPVYMVTGVKVAKDFKLDGATSLSKGVAGEAGGEVAAEASVGGGAGVQRTNRIADQFEAEGDIIFAYQLIKIKPKGWSKEKTFKIEEYQHKQAFLEDDDKKKEEDVDGELGAVTAEDLEEFKKAEVVGLDGVTVAYELPRGR